MIILFWFGLSIIVGIAANRRQHIHLRHRLLGSSLARVSTPDAARHDRESRSRVARKRLLPRSSFWIRAYYFGTSVLFR